MMIDTTKYEGHTEGAWKIVCYERKWYIENEDGWEVCDLNGTAQKKDPTARLIADAPLLLAEVKRLQALLDASNERARLAIENHPFSDEMLSELMV